MPPQKGWPPLRSWPALGVHCVRALLELTRARQQFSTICVRAIQKRNEIASREAFAVPDAVSEPNLRKIAWISYAIPRVARVVPWRSDCLVQALAGQNWLSSMGIASEIVIGVELPQNEDFGSHAWLTCGDVTVTGGKTEHYTVIV